MSSVSVQSWNPNWRAFTVLTMGIEVGERVAHQLPHAVGLETVAVDDRVPCGGFFEHLALQEPGRWRPGFDAQRFRDGGPDVGPDEDVTVGDVERFVATRGCGGRPLQHPGDDARVDRLLHTGWATRIAEWTAPLAADRAMDAQGGDRVHRAADCMAEDDLRAQDRPPPVPAGLSIAQEVLLKPVEVFVVVPRPAFPGGNLDRVDVNAVRLGALQQ
jgi:hypothetical protein